MITDTSQKFFFDTNNTAVEDKMNGMHSDHRQWLEIKPLDELPVIINAQFYELVELIHGLKLITHAI